MIANIWYLIIRDASLARVHKGLYISIADDQTLLKRYEREYLGSNYRMEKGLLKTLLGVETGILHPQGRQ